MKISASSSYSSTTSCVKKYSIRKWMAENAMLSKMLLGPLEVKLTISSNFFIKNENSFGDTILKFSSIYNQIIFNWFNFALYYVKNVLYNTIPFLGLGLCRPSGKNVGKVGEEQGRRLSNL